MKYRFENVICERVVDGDTIDAKIDFGFKLMQKVRLRLFGINAPETRGEEREEGLMSKNELKNLIEGKAIKIETHKKGKFGRYLAVVKKGRINVNDWLVKNKLAEYKEY